MGIGTRYSLAQDFTLSHFTHEQRMAAQILLGKHLAGEHGIGILVYIIQAITAACNLRKFRKLVGIPTGLHTKMANGLKGYILRKHAHIEDAGIFDHLPGQIPLLDRNGQLGGVAAYLEAGIGNAAVILFLIPGGQYKQAVA